MKLTTIERGLIAVLPPQDGVAAADMEIVSVDRGVTARVERVARGLQACETQTIVTLRHPTHGDIPVTIRDGRAAWPYLGESCEVNGVVYGSLRRARQVREALAAEGIAHHYPGTPEARAALRKHGVEKTPQVGEEWGCGDERGIIQRFTSDSRAVLLPRRGPEFTLSIHVLSPTRAGLGS